MISIMHLQEQLHTPVVQILAVAAEDRVVDGEVDKEMDGRGTNTQTSKWAIIPPKQAK